MAGYSGTPLFQKLGIKESMLIGLINEPPYYIDLLSPLPENVTFSKTTKHGFHIVHLFTKSKSDLKTQLPKLMKKIVQEGMIWVSWPKKSSLINTDITEDVIRQIALPLGLVDVKVCAIDETWSGLKLVIRKEKRK